MLPSSGYCPKMFYNLSKYKWKTGNPRLPRTARTTDIWELRSLMTDVFRRSNASRTDQLCSEQSNQQISESYGVWWQTFSGAAMLPEQISYAPRTARTCRYLKVTEFDDRRFQVQQCSQNRLVNMLPEQLEPADIWKLRSLMTDVFRRSNAPRAD